ncbi:MAG: type II toxin-antitoxin system VapC family toxin, partial [bacterium]|nr:type II toxin-antitoxin system VapC family toxin [bacterium]
MTSEDYLLDTHCLFFWANKENISPDFIAFLDSMARKGKIFISPVSFWEIALLTKKERLEIEDVHQWKDNILRYSQAKMLHPTASDMIDS